MADSNAGISSGLSANALPPNTAKGLSDRVYDKRKLAALEVERLVRESLLINDHRRVSQILNTLIQDYAYSVIPNSRNGGLIALAATAIALGSSKVGMYLDSIVPPILACFIDPDSRVRYYACESMYNVAKVARDDVLKYFNEIFDMLSNSAADNEVSVKNGAELLDRLIKDITDNTYDFWGQNLSVPSQSEGEVFLSPAEPAFPAAPGSVPLLPGMKANNFNLQRFIPLLKERIQTLSPFTRMFLVQWIAVLDSVPDLELIAYLPDFLDGLFNYLSDPNVDVRVATLNILGEFLKEIREVVEVQRDRGVMNIRGKKGTGVDGLGVVLIRRGDDENDTASIRSTRTVETGRVEGEQGQGDGDDQSVFRAASALSMASGVPASIAVSRAERQAANESLPYIPGQGVTLDIATALRWVNEFILLVREVMLPFTPMLLSAILPCLSHTVIPIRNIAMESNANLYRLILDTPLQNITQTAALPSPPLPLSDLASPQVSFQSQPDLSNSMTSVSSANVCWVEPFDLKETVESLTGQFQDENEDTRIAAMEWLLMLHRKAPKRFFMTSDDVTFFALLRTLSDTSEEVVKRDLQLLAQISHHSDDDYFMRFMVNLLSLFSNDRRLLESRGALIIRQLCLSLNPERIYRAFAEILERDEDLEFASTMVQNLNIILITAPELTDLRRKLKNLDTRDGLLLFAALYRSWCHNPVAAFSLCLLAQAYEHAANLLQIFADLEITVTLLIQIDKLVQLLESPVFTYLRLQLLEPDRYPHLFRCLYGILMLLPQSSAFATLRNRLNSVSSMVMLYATAGPLSAGAGAGGAANANGPVPAKTAQTARGKPANVQTTSGQQEPLTLRWHELLSHFRGVQARHERSRRLARAAAGVSMDRTSASKRRSRSVRVDEYSGDLDPALPQPRVSIGSPSLPGGTTVPTGSPIPTAPRTRDRQSSMGSASSTTLFQFEERAGNARSSLERLDRTGGTGSTGGVGMRGSGCGYGEAGEEDAGVWVEKNCIMRNRYSVG
ncbi:vacuolar protein 14 C-terminal Fig4p binding-domain-containing protein [Chytridium lagenaria]|nr:vacuolar protein 14 C-terminal Fig4p binding-domain-containing protein [Chytridium lagenaria]